MFIALMKGCSILFLMLGSDCSAICISDRFGLGPVDQSSVEIPKTAVGLFNAAFCGSSHGARGFIGQSKGSNRTVAAIRAGHWAR